MWVWIAIRPQSFSSAKYTGLRRKWENKDKDKKQNKTLCVLCTCVCARLCVCVRFRFVKGCPVENSRHNKLFPAGLCLSVTVWLTSHSQSHTDAHTHHTSMSHISREQVHHTHTHTQNHSSLSPTCFSSFRYVPMCACNSISASSNTKESINSQAYAFKGVQSTVDAC